MYNIVSYVLKMILRYTGGIYMKGKMNTDLGQVLISPEVIAKYAGTTACECLVLLVWQW